MARRDKPVNMPMWLPFTVDSWDRVSCHGKRHHFLTHAHTDHMAGLAAFKTADRTIYCSRTTRDLVVRHFPQLGNAKFCFLEVDGGEMILEDEDKAFNISVRAFDANHCPGAIMLLFYVEDHGYVLHTGDARLAEARVVRPVKAFLRRRPLECLFMDCTYGNKAYGFPTKEDAVRQVCDVIARHTEDGQQVFLACDQLGMEEIHWLQRLTSANTYAEVLEGVFAKFGCGFWVDRSNASVSAQTWWDDLTFMHPEWLVNDPKSTRFHLCDGRALGVCAKEARRKAAETGGDPPVFIRPSSQFFVHDEVLPGDDERPRVATWQQPVAAEQDSFGIYRVLFSMHSSRSELMRAVEILAPRHVVHFVGEMGTELRTVVGRVTGGSLVSNTWLGPVRRDPPGREPRADEGDPPLGRELRTNEGEPSPRREPRADEGAPSVDSEDENAEGGSLKGSPSKSRGESSGDERRGKAVENGVGGEVTKGGAEVDVDPTPSLEKWDEYVPEAPPSPPMSFASSQGVGPESEERGEEVSGRCTEGPGVSRGGTGRLQIDLTPCEGVEQSAECGGPLGESQDENLRESASQESAGQGSPSSKNPRSSKAKVNMGNGSPAKENIPPQGNGLRDGSGCSSETVEVVGLPPSARLKGGRPEGLGNASGTERNGTERNGTERIGTERSGMELNGGWEEAVLATEVVRNVGEGRRGAEVQNGDESVGRERKRGGELQRDQGDCGDSGVSGGEPTDQVASQSPEHECSARLGDDRSALKRKASSVRSPARAIPKNGAIYRAFERQGVAQPIPLPHQRARIRTYY